MSYIVKDSFYKDRLFNASVSSWGGESNDAEQKKLKELSKNPMTADIIQGALGNFGKTAKGPQYAYLSFIAVEKDLNSIQGIEVFNHLQHVDVSRNNLITLRPLSFLKFVTYLNASHNKLTKCLDLKQEIPFCLEELDLSFNNIQVIPDLSKHRFLKKLNLNNNLISLIEGVNKNSNLQVLSLQENKISNIENLDNMNLTELNLRGNNITQITGLDKLEKLRILNLSCNQIKKLKGLIELISIRELWLSNNQIIHIRELQYIENLTYLSVLDLCFNPVQTVRYYRYQVLYHLPGLRILDGVLTIPEEFVKSENLYGLDLEERRRIFKEILPDEEFIDRRINIGELIEPETESDNEEDIKFQDKYDKEGNLIESKSQLNFKKSMTGSLKSAKQSQNSINNNTDALNSHQSLMNETARKLKAMRTSSIDKQNSQESNPFGNH